MPSGSRFVVRSSVESAPPDEIVVHLERTWRSFRDLFAVEPSGFHVVLSMASGGAQAATRADQGGIPAGRTMAWSVVEGEELAGQGFSDLSHEIAHIYFLDLMGSPQGVHPPHAWLHEAVACYHESPTFVAHREEWIRERLGERVPLLQLFEMRNPVKESPLVELTVDLHGKLARGEISVVRMNEEISAWASGHAQELVQSGVRSMTWYAESLSVLQFLLAREGKPFVRSMARCCGRGPACRSCSRSSSTTTSPLSKSRGCAGSQAGRGGRRTPAGLFRPARPGKNFSLGPEDPLPPTARKSPAIDYSPFVFNGLPSVV